MPEHEKGGMGRLSFFLLLSQAKIATLRGEIERLRRLSRARPTFHAGVNPSYPGENAVMRILKLLLGILLFFLLFGFAIKNGHHVDVFFFFEKEWSVPLIFILLTVFAVGALLGVIAPVLSLLARRREISRLRRELARAERGQETRAENTAVTSKKAA